MDFNELYKIKDEIEQIQKTYEIFNEDTRLNRSKAARVEFLTNVKYIEKYLSQGDSILDVGAGAGEYSFYFARNGYKVSALELTDTNIKAFRAKMREEDNIDLMQGNAIDLSAYGDNSFDVVLLFGPLYHLHNEGDNITARAAAKTIKMIIRTKHSEGWRIFAMERTKPYHIGARVFQRDVRADDLLYIVASDYFLDDFSRYFQVTTPSCEIQLYNTIYAEKSQKTLFCKDFFAIFRIF